MKIIKISEPNSLILSSKTSSNLSQEVKHVSSLPEFFSLLGCTIEEESEDSLTILK